MTEELIRAACESANCKYPDMEAMANFKREVTPSVVIGLIDGLRHAKGIAAINDARANGAAETIQHLRAENAALRAQLPNQGGEAVAWHTDDHLTDKSATTYDREVVERWRAKDWPVTTLYTHPADQVAEGVAVSRKRLEHWADKLEGSESNGYGWEDALAAELRALLNGGRDE